MAHGLVRIGEKRILPSPCRRPFGIGPSAGGGNPWDGYFPSSGDGEPVVLEDFNDGDISDYVGDMDHFQPNTTVGDEGAWCLSSKPPLSDGSWVIYRTDESPAQKDRLRCMTKSPIPDDAANQVGLLFGVQDADNFYCAEYHWIGALVKLFKVVAGVWNELASAGVSLGGYTWYHITVDWTSAGLITATFEQEGDDVVISDTDVTWSSGGFGWRQGLATASRYGYWDYLIWTEGVNP